MCFCYKSLPLFENKNGLNIFDIQSTKTQSDEKHHCNIMKMFLELKITKKQRT